MNTYNESELKQFCEKVLENMGMCKDYSEVVADSLIKANLEGTDSHGISRLPIYAKRFMDKRIKVNPDVKITKKAPSVLQVDGDNGLGHIVSWKAIKEGIDTAKETGTAAIGIRNSNHFGTASYFCQMACEENLACVGFTNSPPGIAPWGGKEAFFGTNPIAFGFPTGNDQPVIIDLSTSIAARGKIILAAKQGTEIPDDWAIDENGYPTKDPAAALNGSVLPLGGAKGAALALAVEILTGVLSGAAFGPHVKNLYDDNETENANVGHFFLLLDIEKFMDLSLFFSAIQNLLKEMKEVPKKPDAREIRYPGERRKRESDGRLLTGIKLSGNVEQDLKELGDKFNIPFPETISLDNSSKSLSI
ncbi:lactate dehydrogenase [Sporosarcina globispora]|uniref:Lactate dehydrogenase n=1 Tax=Sporosarcina globispora TaxID=1459 RepID=A0A0M0GHT7_SPOGL|nr:Ldh family oxidoreductase [Sporosarcina globispora]KON88996.1 lactate dehydrogenase [Sporosarcina globispora]